MRYHRFQGEDYVPRADYEAVVERARALDLELAGVRAELEAEQAGYGEVIYLRPYLEGSQPVA